MIYSYIGEHPTILTFYPFVNSDRHNFLNTLYYSSDVTDKLSLVAILITLFHHAKKICFKVYQNSVQNISYSPVKIGLGDFRKMQLHFFKTHKKTLIAHFIFPRSLKTQKRV